VQVARDATNVLVEVSNPRFQWHCGAARHRNGSADWTTAPDGTNLVSVSRGADRRIDWKCYRRTRGMKQNDIKRGVSLSALRPHPRPVSMTGMYGEVFNWAPQESETRPWPLGDTEIQDGWRWCSKCAAIWFSLNPSASVCPAGGSHGQEGSGHYFIPHNVSPRIDRVSRSWRHCPKCQGLWGTDWPGRSGCPAGGEHATTGSGYYALLSMTPPLGSANNSLQDNWHFCQKCHGLWFAVNNNGRCAVGSGHTHAEGRGVEMLHRASVS
jgi:hypothetical protein